MVDGGYTGFYRGSQWNTPVREYKRAGPKAALEPPKGYGTGKPNVGDRVYIVPACSVSEDPGGYGTMVEFEGAPWMAERGWVSVLRDDTEEVSNYQSKCVLVQRDRKKRR